MRRSLLLVGGAVVLVVGLGVGLGVGLSGSSPSSSTGSNASQTQELDSIQSACQQWLHQNSTASGTDQWCTEMTQWMSTYMDRYGVGPQMMWGDPDRLSTLCDQWFSASPPSGAPADARGWCDSMVSWMRANVQRWSGQGSWGDWMDHGPMGGFSAPATGPSTDPSTTSPPATNTSGDTDHDGDCGPGYGDADHDGDCGAGTGGPGYGSGSGDVPGPGYGPGYMGHGYGGPGYGPGSMMGG